MLLLSPFVSLYALFCAILPGYSFGWVTIASFTLLCIVLRLIFVEPMSRRGSLVFFIVMIFAVLAAFVVVADPATITRYSYGPLKDASPWLSQLEQDPGMLDLTIGGLSLSAPAVSTAGVNFGSLLFITAVHGPNAFLGLRTPKGVKSLRKLFYDAKLGRQSVKKEVQAGVNTAITKFVSVLFFIIFLVAPFVMALGVGVSVACHLVWRVAYGFQNWKRKRKR